MENQIVISLNQYNLTSRYKAEVRAVSPKTERENLEQYSSCFIGISLDNPNFLSNKLETTINWASQRFDRCTLLLGDHVHRLTLQIRKELDAQNSLYHALALGDYYLRTHSHLLYHSRTGEPLKVLRGSDIHELPEVIGFVKQMRQLYETNPIFRASVTDFAGKFIMRSEDFADEDIQRRSLSCSYVLEELAETCYMISQGHNVLVYPGSLAIFQQIADTGFAGMPPELTQLINIGLRLKRRGKKLAA